MIQFIDFKGEVPSRAARLIPPGYAKRAVDARLNDGSLTPVQRPDYVTSFPNRKKTIYLHQGTWLAWTTEVHAVPGPVASERLYYTGDAGPKLFVDGVEHVLGITPPLARPGRTALVAHDINDFEEFVFVYTFVTDLGEESAPSPASNPVKWTSGNIRLNFDPPQADRRIDRIRLYRSQTSAAGITDLYFVEEFPVTGQYDHDVEANPIGELLAVGHFDTPKLDLQGLVGMPNGMMVAFRGQELHFSEPYQPHAWPASYTLNVDYEIVGLAAFGSSLAVMTKGTPYRGQGTHPDNFLLEKIEENLPCVSSRSIVDLGYAAAYASRDGLAVIDTGGVRMVSRGIFTREQWHALIPSTMVAAQSNGRYVFAFDGNLSGGTERMAAVDLTGSQPFLIRSGSIATALYYDTPSANLYFTDEANDLFRFDPTEDSEPYKVLTWRSGEVVSGHPVNLGALYVEGVALASNPQLQIRIYADGVQRVSHSRLNEVLRLPGGFLARRWEVEIIGAVEVTSIVLAANPGALAASR